MKFDLLARAVERHVPSFRSSVEIAALIEAPRYDPDTMECRSLDQQFRLPWNCVCIEDDVSVVLIQRRGRVVPGGGELHLAAGAERTTTKDLGIEKWDGFRVALMHEHAKERGRPAGVFVDLMAAENVEHRGDYASIGWSVDRIFGVDAERELVYTPGHTYFEEIQRHLIQNVTVALSQCVMISRPGTWIVKRLPTTAEQALIAKRTASAKKVARSHERERWLLITDKERERYFRDSAGHAEGDTSSVTPHPRRAHFRHIGANADGTRRHTWVRACWVGSTEAEIHGARYRVELDL
jgi:hypothetical protein